MFNTPFSTKKGMTMIEVCIALFLVGIGILALITLQPSALRLSGKSDYLGRASGVLAAQLQALETQIINPNNSIPASGSNTVYVSGQNASQRGDAAFTVGTTVTDLGNSSYLVNVHVTWAGSSAGIKESMIVTRQQSFAE